VSLDLSSSYFFSTAARLVYRSTYLDRLLVRNVTDSTDAFHFGAMVWSFM
jgi:hypothetical protein